MTAGTDALVAWAPAKVNLHLEVTARRPDGYHAIETLMVAVDLFDTLELRDDPNGGIELRCETPGVPGGPGNLVHKVATDLKTRFAGTRGATIELTKRIPHEAGLGGGSSDAATTLLALNRLWNLGLSLDELREAASRHGSDIGLFLTPPAGWCTGRGEIVEPEAVGKPLDFVIVKPAVGAATGEVYRRLKLSERTVSGEAIRQALRDGDPEAVARHLHNRLQEPAFELRPEIAAVHRRLSGCGGLGCQMSGSGSAVFAVAADREQALKVAERYRAAERRAGTMPRSQVFVVRSFNSQPR